MTKYIPYAMTYTYQASSPQFAIFSEVYYPGWTATIDGQNVELGRVNYVLRALNVKAGEHKVELKFFPTSVNTTESIAYASFGVLVLVVLLIVFFEWKKNHKTKE